MYKEFDWDNCKATTNPVKFNYLKNYWNKEVSEEKFIEDWQKFKSFSLLHTKKGKPFHGVSEKISKRYAPSSIRKVYRNLRDKFGFFIGVNNLYGK